MQQPIRGNDWSTFKTNESTAWANYWCDERHFKPGGYSYGVYRKCHECRNRVDENGILCMYCTHNMPFYARRSQQAGSWSYEGMTQYFLNEVHTKCNYCESRPFYGGKYCDACCIAIMKGGEEV